MKIQFAQASDRIMIQIKDGNDIEISFNAADMENAPSSCVENQKGREVPRQESQQMGSMTFWEVNIP